MTSDNTAIILLAAGASTRMGQSKQLLPIDGEPLLLRSVRAALGSSIKTLVVVLGANEEKHKAILKGINVDVVSNRDWEKGIGSSIKAGLRYLVKNNPDLESVIILLCDQPLLTSGHINSLVEERDKSEKIIVASTYGDTIGVPALFRRDCFNELLNLPDPHGAKKIIEDNPARVMVVKLQGGEIDLDTTVDYERFVKKPGNEGP